MKQIMSTPIPLNAEEIQAIQKLAQNISDIGFNDWFLEHKNLVRYLRARKGSLKAAEDMIRNYVQWIVGENIPHVIFTWTPPPEFKKVFSWRVCGIDQFGGPIVVSKLGDYDPAILQGRRDDLVMYIIYHLEHWSKYFLSRTRGFPNMPQFVSIADVKGLSWKHYMNYDVIQAGIRAIKIFDSYYPETLRVSFLLNAPPIITWFWKIAKPLLNARTQEKINIIYGEDKKQWIETITKYISEDKVPKEFGGNLSNDVEIPLILTEDEIRTTVLFANNNERETQTHSYT